MFYYFLGNIRPKLRSVLRCTQLIACTNTSNLDKYGFEKILEPFIRDANKLYKVRHAKMYYIIPHVYITAGSYNDN